MKVSRQFDKKDSVIVVEGYLDFLQLFQSGIDNCVAISGTAFTDQHALQLKRILQYGLSRL